MNPGKEICRELKVLRKQIAEENGIPLEMEECKFKGKCDGTCPRCDAEVRYLESALADRIRMGKVAVVAGLALGLSATATLSAESGAVAFSGVQPVVKELVLPTDSVRITGKVVDSKTGEGIGFANIRVLDGEVMVAGTCTDSNGNFTMQVSKGIYNVKITYIGYFPFELTNCDWSRSDKFDFENVGLEYNGKGLTKGIVVKDSDSVPKSDSNGKKFSKRHGRNDSSRRK